MNLVIGFGIVVLATAVTVTVMLLARRRAPEGGYFEDGDRASGVFGVLATGFSVLLGFIIFLAFSSYDESRAGAEREALIVAQQVETAQFFGPASAEELTAELVCYARSVAGPRWELMGSPDLQDTLNPWGVELFHTLQAVEPTGATEEAAYGKWLDQTSDREQARNDRIHGAVGVVPSPLWVALFLVSLIIFAYMLFFADSNERAVVQAMLMGSVTAVITTLLLLLQFFDNPFHADVGGLRPVAMERTLRVIDLELEAAGLDLDLPCDEQGDAR